MIDYSNIPRDSRRVPIETRVQFTFDRFSGFILEYSSNISPGGMFLKTKAPLPLGKTLDFEFSMGDGYELIKGRGEVVWSRQEDDGPTRPAGMGIRFLELSEGSKELIYRMVDQHVQQGGTPFDVSQGDTVSMAQRGSGKVVDDDDPTDASHWLPKLDDVLAEDEPAPSPQAPSRTGAPHHAPTFTAFGSASARPPRSPWPWILIAVVAAMGIILYLLRDDILDYLVGAPESVAQLPKARPTRPAAQRPTPLPDPLTTDADPAAAVATPPAEPTPAAAAPPVVPAAASPVPAGPPLTVVEKIGSRQASGGGTEVVILADGIFSADRFLQMRIEGNPPRELFRITRVERAYPETRITVKTAELLQVRVGYHPEQGNELHVVLDLADPSVQVVKVAPAGRELRIHLLRR
jgi:uncharacterized protein (TIGR02266 family)